MGRSNLKKLNPRHRMVARLQIQGMGHGEIGATLGLTPGGVSGIVNDPTYQEYIQGLMAELDDRVVEETAEAVVGDPIRETFKANAEKAANTLVRLLDSANAGVAQKSAFDILDRAGYGKEEKSKTEMTLNISKVAEDHLSKALAEIGVDMDPKEFVLRAVEGPVEKRDAPAPQAASGA